MAAKPTDLIFKKFEEEITTPLVDELMTTRFNEAPVNPLVSSETWKNSVRRELTDCINGVDILERLNTAFEAIALDIKAHLSPVEQEKIQAEWEAAVDKFVVLSQEPPKEGAASQVAELIGISESTLMHFYGVGIRLFESRRFAEAEAVFSVITILDFRYHNVWLSLGLCQQQNGHFEEALNAFAMATMMNINAPLPYIHSAECSIVLGNKEEAREYLHLAEDALKKEPLPNNSELLSQIRKLQQNS